MEGIEIKRGYELRREVKSTRMQLLIRPSTKKALQNIAQEEEISMNELINRILENYIDEREC